MKTTKTKPCPFCNSNNLGVRVRYQDRNGWPVSIICRDCGAEGPSAYHHSKNASTTEVAASTGWNERG